MDAWIPVTIAAALAQTLRFMLQRSLAGGGGLSAAGATFARFVYAAPLAVLAAFGWARFSGQALPGVPAGFWPWALAGGISQILATICTVLLLGRRNFAVGITFKKTEVILSVLAGWLLLGEGVGPGAFAAICVGLGGVLLLSDVPGGAGPWHRRIRNRSAGLGLLSGLFFAVSGNGYRAASLGLDGGDTLLRALVTLSLVTISQTLILGAWLAWRERGEIGRVLRRWRVAGLVGVTSMIGSACWFTAFTLQTVGLVNAVGQVELIFSLAVSALVFRESITWRELAGVAVLGASILGLIAFV
ncbi:DMT family transporter [Wenxinia saemankumensis]|uniref:EamA-like transporter family protein n=1 Tax=Wenxinia saemankumensis TaxID=1447782 RepID=A0A1M6CSG6_9RHOB|nr:DMT family transporter [Wenxinia saemankumensis]SHI63962.1 EamA-like transporter family protein [Wenxinia saemankumensis]